MTLIESLTKSTPQMKRSIPFLIIAIVLVVALGVMWKMSSSSRQSNGPQPVAMPSPGSLPPGATPTNPYAGQAASISEGEKLFASMNCDGCHGGGATGWVGPSLSDGRWIYGGSDAAVFQSIYYGRPHGMPAFGGTLTPPIVWKLVTYLRSLPVPKSVPTQAW